MFEALKYSLKNVLLAELPGSAIHVKMLPPGRRLKTFSHELSSVKMSSVLVLLYPEGDQLYTCLTRRPTTMKHHPGQISFPGGKVEKDDLSAEMAALRESREEVGIDPSTIEVLGKLSDLYVEVSRFSIQPFLAWADRKPDFIVDYQEVEELILFPVSNFVADETILETELQTVSGLLSVKYYPFNNQIIWGATAMILAELIELLKSIDR